MIHIVLTRGATSYDLTEIDVGGGSTVSLLQHDSLTLDGVLYGAEFKPAVGSADWEILFDSDIISWIEGNEEATLVEILDGTTPLFTGYLRPTTGFPLSGPADKVKMSALDTTVLLESTIEEAETRWYWVDEMKAAMASGTDSMVHELLKRTKLWTGTDWVFPVTVPDRDIVVPLISLKRGESAKDRLDALCFQFGLSYHSLPDGTIEFFRWDLDDPTPTATITESGIKRKLDVAHKDAKEKAVIVQYQKYQDTPEDVPSFATIDCQDIVLGDNVGDVYHTFETSVDQVASKPDMLPGEEFGVLDGYIEICLKVQTQKHEWNLFDGDFWGLAKESDTSFKLYLDGTKTGKWQSVSMFGTFDLTDGIIDFSYNERTRALHIKIDGSAGDMGAMIAALPDAALTFGNPWPRGKLVLRSIKFRGKARYYEHNDGVSSAVTDDDEAPRFRTHPTTDKRLAKEYISTLVADASVAESTAWALFHNITGAKFTAEMLTPVDLGQVVTLDIDMKGFSALARVVELKTFPGSSNLPMATFESLQPYTLVHTPITITPTTASPPLSPAQQELAMLLSQASNPNLIAPVVDQRYLRSATKPATPTLDDPDTWIDHPYDGDDPLWVIQCRRDRDGTMLDSWTDPVRVDGEAAFLGAQSAEPTANVGDWYYDTDTHEMRLKKISGWDTDDDPGRFAIAMPAILVAESADLGSNTAAISYVHALVGTNAFFDAIAARTLEITGTIHVGAGDLGGLSINASGLTAAGSGSNYVGIDSSGAHPAFWAGDAVGSAAPFRVAMDGTLYATSGTVGGFTLGTSFLDSDSAGHARIRLDKTNNRVAVLDSFNTVKTAMGYLGGLLKQGTAWDAAKTYSAAGGDYASSGGTIYKSKAVAGNLNKSPAGNPTYWAVSVDTWSASDYGFYASVGNTLKFDGDLVYQNGSMLLANDASLTVQSGATVVLRMGTYAGAAGFFANEGQTGANYRAHLTATDFFVGNDAANISFSGGSLALLLTSFKVATSLTSVLGSLEISQTGTIGALTNQLTLTADATSGRLNHATKVQLQVNGTAHVDLDSTGNIGFSIAATNLGDATAHRLYIVAAGDGVDSVQSCGVFALVNNRATVASGDTCGMVSFGSLNNGTTPSLNTRQVARIAGSSVGSGGTNGFGGKLGFATKPDNSTALTNALVLDENQNALFGRITTFGFSNYGPSLQLGALATTATPSALIFAGYASATNVPNLVFNHRGTAYIGIGPRGSDSNGGLVIGFCGSTSQTFTSLLLDINGNGDVSIPSGNLSVTGDGSFSGNLTVTGRVTDGAGGSFTRYLGNFSVANSASTNLSLPAFTGLWVWDLNMGLNATLKTPTSGTYRWHIMDVIGGGGGSATNSSSGTVAANTAIISTGAGGGLVGILFLIRVS